MEIEPNLTAQNTSLLIPPKRNPNEAHNKQIQHQARLKGFFSPPNHVSHRHKKNKILSDSITKMVYKPCIYIYIAYSIYSRLQEMEHGQETPIVNRKNCHDFNCKTSYRTRKIQSIPFQNPY